MRVERAAAASVKVADALSPSVWHSHAASLRPGVRWQPHSAPPSPSLDIGVLDQLCLLNSKYADSGE